MFCQFKNSIFFENLFNCMAGAVSVIFNFSLH